MIFTKQVCGLDMMNFQVSGALRFFAAVLAGCIVALNSQAALPAPVPAIVRMAARSATIRWVVCANDMLCSAIYRAIEVLVFALLGWRYAKGFTACFAVDHNGGKAIAKLEFRRTTQSTENMFSLFVGAFHAERFSALLAGHFADGILGPFGAGMLDGAVDVICPESVYAPPLHFDRCVTESANRIEQVVSTLNITLADVPSNVLEVRMFDYPTTSAIA